MFIAILSVFLFLLLQLLESNRPRLRLAHADLRAAKTLHSSSGRVLHVLLHSSSIERRPLREQQGLPRGPIHPEVGSGFCVWGGHAVLKRQTE